MIQRIQSVYLFCASLAIYAMFLFPIAHNVYVGPIPITIKVTGVYQDLAGHMFRTTSFLVLTIATIVIGLIPLFILMRFRDRKQQIALCWGYIFVLFGYSFWMKQTVATVVDVTSFHFENFGIGALLTSLSIVFTLLASTAIKRDEKLVKSADRLR